jgi:polyisoprenoid-binding protein YceI
MRIFLVICLLFVGFAVFSDVTISKNPSFEEKFSDKKQTEDMSGTYSLDKAHSSIGFKVKHYGLVDVPGYFRDFKGTINYNAKDMTKSTVEFSAQMKSVDTGIAGRDDHLRRADFFEVEKYPEMTFKSTKVEKKKKQWLITGDFTMKGVTKTVTFPFNLTGFAKDQRGTKMGVTAETSINRRDFGVNYGNNLPNGVAALSDNVVVMLELECNLQPAK